jgi:signal transduction histidine kinase
MTKVLIAEDNLALLDSIALELEMRGYEVVQVTDGRGALQALETASQLPDIIVSDIAMPDMDGFALLELVRQNPSWNGLPFLFLTAFNSENYIRLSKELGVDDYLVKPFRSDDLIIAMESKLRRIKGIQSQADRHLDHSRDTLLNMMAQEMRTPLLSIYGGTERLMEILQAAPDETVQRVLELIRNGAGRLDRITRKAMALVEIDSGNLHTLMVQDQRRHRIRDVLNHAVETIEHENFGRDLQVTLLLNPEQEKLEVQGIFEYLVMLVEELLRNAAAFSPDGSSVMVAVRETDAQMSIVITDHGIGIPESEMERIWQRFSHVKRDEPAPTGVGLGLAVVRDVARLHGGDCTITSTLGAGTEAVLTLPRPQREAAIG